MAEKPHLLIVEDNTGLREQMKWAFYGDYDVLEAGSSRECSAVFEKNAPSLVCLDMGLDNVPDKGLEIIDELVQKNRRVKIVVITAHTSETLGSQAVAQGAFDYLRKPVDIDELRVILERAARMTDLEKTPEASTGEQGLESTPDSVMIGRSEKMRRIFGMIEKLAATDVSVLITGDSGTGKELCARAIHLHSTRTAHAFVPINCGAIPETLLESELFGYVKGAFTGATADKKGLIEAADGGTLFLDEIADMPRHLQVKLLRFLEDQRFSRLGETTERQADVRIVAATNNMEMGSESGESMRSDLYYRLSEFEIHLPPLCERGEDIILLARSIIERHRARFDAPKLHLSPRAERLLLGYNWPGNVRELENKLSRAAITCVNQTIEPDDLQLSAASYSGGTLKEARDMFEREFVSQAIRKTNGNIAAAAKKLGVSRPTLYDLIKRLDISITTRATLE